MKRYLSLFLFMFISFQSVAEAVNCDDEYEEAKSQYNTLMKKSDQFGRPMYSVADIQTFKDGLDKKRYVCKNNVDIEAFYIQTLLMLGDLNAAKKESDVLIKNNPNSALSFSTAAMVMSTFGDLEQEVEYLRKAIHLDPKAIHNQLNLCSRLESGRVYSEAVIECTKYIENNTKHVANVYYIRWRAYKGLGKMELAKKDFEMAEKLGSDAAKYYSDEHYGK